MHCALYESAIALLPKTIEAIRIVDVILECPSTNRCKYLVINRAILEQWIPSVHTNQYDAPAAPGGPD